MPSSRRYVWLALAALSLLLAGLGLSLGVWLALMPSVSIDPETCDKIKPGMTMKEVETIIGGRPGFYGVSGVQSEAPPSKDGWSWVSRRWEIVVMLDRNERVRSANCYRVKPLD